MTSILIIEDDSGLNKGIALSLIQDDFLFYSAFSIEEAKQYLEQYDIDLLLLDVNLPDGNGFDFCKEVREKSDIPIIFLTGNKQESDIVMGFAIGGDDYVTKPFSLMVLRSRVMAVLKHTSQRKLTIYHSQNKKYEFDFDTMLFLKNGKEIILSRTEQKLLRILVLNQGITLTRNNLIDKIWTNSSEYVDETALTVTISRLRNKLEDNPVKPERIKTVYGMGYVWNGDKYE